METTKDENTLTPEQTEKLHEILKVFSDMLVKHAAETREKKQMGGFIDKPYYMYEPGKNDIETLFAKVKQKLKDGGKVGDDFPGPDDPIGQTKYFINVLSPPSNSYEQFLLESLEADLKKLQSKEGK